MTEGKHKPFSKAVYDAHDAAAKVAVRKYLDKLGHLTVVQEDFDADIYALKPVKHEVEVKLGWENTWPAAWRTVHIPERKKRLIKEDVEIIFWILSANRKEACLVSSKALHEDQLTEIKNKEVPEGELFYDVPLELCTFVRLEDADI